MTSSTALINFLNSCAFNFYSLFDGSPACMTWASIMIILGIIGVLLITISYLIPRISFGGVENT